MRSRALRIPLSWSVLNTSSLPTSYRLFWLDMKQLTVKELSLWMPCWRPDEFPPIIKLPTEALLPGCKRWPFARWKIIFYETGDNLSGCERSSLVFESFTAVFLSRKPSGAISTTTAISLESSGWWRDMKVSLNFLFSIGRKCVLLRRIYDYNLD